MRTRLLCLPLALVPAIAAACATGAPPEEATTGQQQSALGGIEGTFEAALDAPWRIEPAVDIYGLPTYGAIPIQLSIHDAYMAGYDHGRFEFSPTGEWKYVPTNPQLGKFCEIVIEQEVGGTVYRDVKTLSSLTEIEATTGPWRPGGSHPLHQVCKPSSSVACNALEDIGVTSEWHAGAWYYPQGSLKPGMDIPLKLSARITRDPATPCDSTKEKDFLTITNWVRVHLGEAPLPRFDARWLYGDVHYHSQGTDNEGEAGYHYRGVMRAIGAMGIDFAVASDHASSSEQLVDVDVNVYPLVIELEQTWGVLRDMNATRFSKLNHAIWKSGGVNAGALEGPNGAPPQGYLSHGVVPRILLGGEVDVIPEIDKSWDGKGFFFGNGLRMEIDHLCGGWLQTWFTIDGDCEPDKLRFPAGNSTLFYDVQGVHEYGPARAHMVYLPRTSTEPNAFVGSFTGKYGGASRRLTRAHDGQDAMLPEIEKKGYAFLAHPVPAGACPEKDYGEEQPETGASLRADLEGGAGPDGVPYTPSMLDQAFRSPAVLGLQFWNENTRLCTELGEGDAEEFGFEGPGLAPFKKLERFGFMTGHFGLMPFFDKKTGEYAHSSTGVEWMLHHGARQWDDLLQKGIDPVETGSLSWLPTGHPRRVLMAGGSDAHGDFNYRREGYMTGTTKITDTALAKVRNLVFAGWPDELRDNEPLPTHSHEKIVSAMARGNFAVTDGPALRIVVDNNRNGIIDDADTPMGGIVELYGEEKLSLLVEWKSTAEFGVVTDVQLYVGVQAGGDDGRSAATYAVKGHGPQSKGIALSDVVSSYGSNGLSYNLMKDGYTEDPTGLLSFEPRSMSGVKSIELPIATFEAGRKIAPERLYVRAFASTAEQDARACMTDPAAQRKGACIRRYGFTNPIWAIPGSKGKDRYGKGAVLAVPQARQASLDGRPAR